MPRRWIFLAALFVVLASTVRAQPRRVEVISAEDRDLKRTAFQLGVTPAELKQVRELVEEATELAMGAELDSSWKSIWPLLRLWRKVETPAAAIPRMQAMAEKLKRTARLTDRAETYVWCLQNAQGAVFSQPLSPAELEKFFRAWPERQDLGESAQQALRQVRESIEVQRMSQAVEEDPLQGARLLQASGSPASLGLALRVAERLCDQGEKEQAWRLLESMLEDFRVSPATLEMSNLFSNLMRLLGDRFPSRFVPALQLWVARRGEYEPLLDTYTTELESEAESVTLSGWEMSLLAMFERILTDPGTHQAALNSVPEFQSKIRRLGGFSAVSRSNRTYRDEAGRMTRTQARSPFARDRLRYRWGEATLNPFEVSSRLQAAFPNEEDFFGVYSSIQLHCYDDADFSRLALDWLAEKTLRFENLETRMERVSTLFNLYRECEGLVDRKVIQAAIALLDEVREADEQDPSSAPDRKTGDRWSNFETRLLAEWSRSDFQEAADRARSAKDPRERLAALIALIEGRIRPRRG